MRSRWLQWAQPKRDSLEHCYLLCLSKWKTKWMKSRKIIPFQNRPLDVLKADTVFSPLRELSIEQHCLVKKRNICQCMACICLYLVFLSRKLTRSSQEIYNLVFTTPPPHFSSFSFYTRNTPSVFRYKMRTLCLFGCWFGLGFFCWFYFPFPIGFSVNGNIASASTYHF